LVLRLKCNKFDFRWGFAPNHARRAYSVPPDLQGGLLLRGEQGRKKKWEWGGRKGEGEEGKREMEGK